jgi:acyl-coenzyme A thioesterase PaaI-like protein
MKETEITELMATREDLPMCFGCGRENPIGLKLDFQWDGKTATAEFSPGEFHQGWPGLVHGGIIFSLLDEAMGYVTHFQGITCLTAKMWTKLKHPISLGEPVGIAATMTKKTRRLIEAKATITLRDGTLAAEGAATMYVLSRGKVEKWKRP